MVAKPEEKTEMPFRNGTYNGQVREGLPHGVGTFICPEFTYTGGWFYGSMNGEGEFLYANGDTYQGELHANKRNGQGVEVAKIMGIKTRYEGGWKDDKKHGKGVEISCIGGVEIRREGEWKDNVKVGVGMETLEDPDVKTASQSSELTKRTKMKIHSLIGKK